MGGCEVFGAGHGSPPSTITCLKGPHTCTLCQWVDFPSNRCPVLELTLLLNF